MEKRFNVTVRYEGTMSYEVEASTETEAIAKAALLFNEENGEAILANIEQADICDCNEVVVGEHSLDNEGNELKEETTVPEPVLPRQTPYERTRAAVYATGNRWAIENFNATHN